MKTECLKGVSWDRKGLRNGPSEMGNSPNCEGEGN